MDLELTRQQIDQIDKELIYLLEKRMDLVNQVVTYKKQTGKAVLDTKREKMILANVTTQVNNQDYRSIICETFKSIMAQSRAYQQKQLKQ